jgi:hypothetical protein
MPTVAYIWRQFTSKQRDKISTRRNDSLILIQRSAIGLVDSSALEHSKAVSSPTLWPPHSITWRIFAGALKNRSHLDVRLIDECR